MLGRTKVKVLLHNDSSTRSTPPLRSLEGRDDDILFTAIGSKPVLRDTVPRMVACLSKR